MPAPRSRQLAFELLEVKASPSALLLALAPLDEQDQRMLESERTMYAPVSSTTLAAQHADADLYANADLLRFIAENTCDDGGRGEATPLPTAAQAAAADRMMQATDTDLRTLLITELVEPEWADESVCSVIQF